MKGMLHGRVAFVTGAAAGLGRAIVRVLAEAGASGLAFDIEACSGDLPRGWLEQRGDVVAEADLETAVARVMQEYGRLDIVVANAGVVPPWHATEDIDFEEWEHVFAVNVKGVAATIKHCVAAMKPNGGSIIAMGSLNSRRAHSRQCLYTASKHAVLGIVRAAALDLGRYGIRVNAVGPGPVATDALVERLRTRARDGGPSPDDVLSEYARDTALGHIVTEDDVAHVVLFLGGELSQGISGQILPVDAGLP